MKYDTARELMQVNVDKSCAKTYDLMNEEDNNFILSTIDSKVLKIKSFLSLYKQSVSYIKDNSYFEDFLEKNKVLLDFLTFVEDDIKRDMKYVDGFVNCYSNFLSRAIHEEDYDKLLDWLFFIPGAIERELFLLKK